MRSVVRDDIAPSDPILLRSGEQQKSEYAGESHFGAVNGM